MKKNLTDNQIIAAIDEAFAIATETASNFLAKNGDQWGACGFAWVVVKPGTSKVARILKTKYGANRHYAGGVSVWAPGAGFTQNMDLKEEAASAFASHLRNELGLDWEQCYCGSRMD